MWQGFVFFFLLMVGDAFSHGKDNMILKGGGSRVFENLMHEWLKDYKVASGLRLPMTRLVLDPGLFSCKRESLITL